MVPTNVTFDYLAKEGASFGLPPESVAKIEDVRSQGLAALATLHDAGVMMAYGSDLSARNAPPPVGRVPAPRRGPAGDRGRSARPRSTPPRSSGRRGQLGVVAPGAHADLIVVDGDP